MDTTRYAIWIILDNINVIFLNFEASFRDGKPSTLAWGKSTFLRSHKDESRVLSGNCSCNIELWVLCWTMQTFLSLLFSAVFTVMGCSLQKWPTHVRWKPISQSAQKFAQFTMLYASCWKSDTIINPLLNVSNHLCILIQYYWTFLANENNENTQFSQYSCNENI